MKFLIWLLVLAAAAVALSLAAHNPGYVLLVYAPYRIHLSLTLFALMLIGLFVLSFLSAQLLIHALNLPDKVRRFRTERAEEKKRGVFLDALTAFLEGRYSTAEKAATQAMGLGETSDVLPVIAARAAHAHREVERRDAFLAAINDDSAMKLAAQAQFALDEQQPQAALLALQALREIGSKHHAGVLSLELKAQQMLGDWDAVLECLTNLEQRHALDVTRLSQLRQHAWQEKLRAHAHDAGQLLATWKAIPEELRHRANIALAAAQTFGAQGNAHLAWQIIIHALETQWDSDLAACLGDHVSNDAAKRTEQAEQLLKAHPDDAGLLLALGKLSLHQQLWGKSHDYLNASLRVKPSRAAHYALGQLAEQQGNSDEALAQYRRAAERRSSNRAK